MTASTGASAAPTGYLRRAREVRPGWWLHFSGTENVATGEVDFTPVWLRVEDVEPLEPGYGGDDLTVRRRRFYFSDGSSGAWMATVDVRALTVRQAAAAGMGTEDPK